MALPQPSYTVSWNSAALTHARSADDYAQYGAAAAAAAPSHRRAHTHTHTHTQHTHTHIQTHKNSATANVDDDRKGKGARRSGRAYVPFAKGSYYQLSSATADSADIPARRSDNSINSHININNNYYNNDNNDNTENRYVTTRGTAHQQRKNTHNKSDTDDENENDASEGVYSSAMMRVNSFISTNIGLFGIFVFAFMERWYLFFPALLVVAGALGIAADFTHRYKVHLSWYVIVCVYVWV